MSELSYVEVHNHTYYSPLDGLSSPAEYFTRAKEVGIDKIAFTDHGTVTGHRECLRAAEGTGITPILGVEAYISETNRFDKRAKVKREDGTNVYNHIILLAKNDNGVKNLNTLSEIGWTEGYYHKPRIDFESLSEHGDDLIVASGCMSGLISKAIERGDLEAANAWALKFKERFGHDFYIELQTHNPLELNKQLLSIADANEIKVISTGDCHYADPADRAFEEVFLILGTGAARGRIKNPDMSRANKLDLMDRLDYLYPERSMSFKEIDVYLERASVRFEQYKAKGIDRPDLFTNTVEVGDKIEGYTLLENLDTLPVMVTSENEDAKLRELCMKGLKFRNLAHKQEYLDRLDEELSVIAEKKFAMYFIVLNDALAFCRREQIAYGMGRGSGCGSLVNYSLQITEVDPIEEQLLFWRFLDLERADPPDVDTDIQDNRRGEVKLYLAQRYGEDHVASISTYTKYKGKSSLAAAAQVLNLTSAERDFISKNLSDFIGDKEATRKNLLEFAKAPVFAELRTKYPDLLPIASKLAERLSSYGIHPGGVVIARNPLRDYVGVESRNVPKELVRQSVLCVDGDDAADIGLIKYDFLGLSTLTAVVDAVDLIKKNHGKIIDWKHMREDDPKVFEMISQGRTVGVFQANKESSTEVIKQMGIDNFRDLVVSNALVRPGAWKAFGKEFIKRKKGRGGIKFPTPDSEKFLGDTYAFALFQEQTMQICTEIAGMSKSDANKVRKLTAKKKDKNELLPYKNAFLSGASKKVGMLEAEKMWADIELTAEYSFNKCLAEDTVVQVKRLSETGAVHEYMTMRELYEAQSDPTYAYNIFYVLGPKAIRDGVEKPFNGESEWHEIKEVHDGGVRDIHRVWFSSDEYIDSSWNHKHLVGRTWKEAGRLFQNDRVHAFDGVRKVWKKTVEAPAQTYDIELFNEPHAFYANGVVTHNSHSVAYSKLSYVTAWLKYYYPAEFLAALLNSEENAKEVSIYMTECKRLGIEVKLPDINKSDLNYTTKDGVIYMGLSNVKGLGGAKAQHVIANRPYTSYADLVKKVNTKGNGLDTGALGALNAVGATEFPDHPIDWDIVHGNLYEFLGIPAFDTGMLSDEMRSRIVELDDFEAATDAAVVNVIVTDIVSKGWIRVDMLDTSGTLGIFVGEDHGLVKGHKYLMVIANKKIVMHMDMSNFDPDHPIISYLRGDMTPGTWAMAAKLGKTRAGKPIATLVYVNNGVLNSCTAFESQMQEARRGFVLGERIRLAVKKSPKFGDIIERVMVYERRDSTD